MTRAGVCCYNFKIHTKRCVGAFFAYGFVYRRIAGILRKGENLVNNKWKYEITALEGGETAAWVLKNRLGLTRREIRRLKFAEGGIRVGGRQIRSNEILRPGDVLEVSKYPEALENIWAEESAKSGCARPQAEDLILYEDEDLLVMTKPPGIAVHPVGCHKMGTLLDMAAEYLGRKISGQGLGCVGRLDVETSGCMVFAKHRLAAARLQRQREQGDFGKEYLAVVTGHMEERTGRVDLPMGKLADDGQRERMQITENGKRAVTHYQVLLRLDTSDLIRLQLETGRTHQIRVHMEAIGHPLEGDLLYGRKTNGSWSRAALHAWQVWFRQPFTEKPILLEAPLPGDFIERLGAAYDIDDLMLSGKRRPIPYAPPCEEKGGCE